jgi:hypothetical protein
LVPERAAGLLTFRTLRDVFLFFLFFDVLLLLLVSLEYLRVIAKILLSLLTEIEVNTQREVKWLQFFATLLLTKNFIWDSGHFPILATTALSRKFPHFRQ